MNSKSIQSQFESFIPKTIGHLRREYPNGVQHRLFGDQDIGCRPRQLHPAFYGCYDWHSAVHSHWQVARAIRHFPRATFVDAGIAALDSSLTPVNIATEVDYISNRTTFEMPYGMAWLLQLTAELREWNNTHALRWLDALSPLEKHAAAQFRVYLGKMGHPVRTGTHNQSAFSLGLAYDWALVASDDELLAQIRAKALQLFGSDQNAPFAYEPSGSDFLSPTLAEADLMRRVLVPDELAGWLVRFLGKHGQEQMKAHLQPVGVGDFSDGQLAHFAGLNMSRAWMLSKIATALPHNNSLATTFAQLAKRHQEQGLGSALHDDYMVSHWAPTFVIYLLTGR